MESKQEENNQIIKEENIEEEKEFFSKENEMIGIVDLLKQSWNIYKENFSKLILVILFPSLISFVIAAVGLLFLTGLTVSVPENISYSDFPWGSFSLIFLTTIVPVIIVQSVGYLALIFAIKDRDKNLGLTQIYSTAFSKIIPYWWTSLIVAIIVSLGSLALIIPGLIFLVWYGFAPLISIIEDKRGWEALKTSKHYVSGRALKIAIRMVLLLIIAIVISFVSEEIAGGLGSQIASFVAAPFFMAYYFLLYKDIKRS
jgi:hypothetical protein